MPGRPARRRRAAEPPRTPRRSCRFAARESFYTTRLLDCRACSPLLGSAPRLRPARGAAASAAAAGGGSDATDRSDRRPATKPARTTEEPTAANRVERQKSGRAPGPRPRRRPLPEPARQLRRLDGRAAAAARRRRHLRPVRRRGAGHPLDLRRDPDRASCRSTASPPSPPPARRPSTATSRRPTTGANASPNSAAARPKSNRSCSAAGGSPRTSSPKPRTVCARSPTESAKAARGRPKAPGPPFGGPGLVHRKRTRELRPGGTKPGLPTLAGARGGFRRAPKPVRRLAALHLQSPSKHVTQIRTTSFLW